MTVTERLMKPGQFSLALDPTLAPYAVWSAVEKFDHIVITPTRLRPIAGFSDANILSAAIYTGVVTGKPTPTDIEGQGLEFWLGTEQGVGDLLDTAVSNTAGSLSTWITSLQPTSLTAGTVNNTGTSTLTYSYQWTTRREALDHMLRTVGAERRINPNFTLDAATSANLFTAYTTPNAVITRQPQGAEGSKVGIEATQVNQSTDVLGYTTKVIVVGKLGDGTQVATGSATGSNVYKDGLNNNVVMERFVDAPVEPAANVATYATNVLNLFGSSRKSVTLSSRTYAVPIRAKPGDRVYVWDQRAGLIDTANQVQWRGELITPVLVRVKSYTWPIQSGMGIYARRSGATPTYIDLSDYVKYEDDTDTTWEIGTSIADQDQDPAQLSPAYLGTNPGVLQRATLGQKQTYTPTWSGTLGNGTLTGYYQLFGDWCRVYISLTWGSTTSHGASIQSFSTPSGVTMNVTTGGWVGGARLIDTGVASYVRHVLTASGTTVSMATEAAVFVTNTVPFTMGNTDQQILQFEFPL